MDIAAILRDREAWSKEQKAQHKITMFEKVQIGDRVFVVFPTGGDPLPPIKNGDIGIVVGKTRTECKCYFPHLSKWNTKGYPVLLYWREICLTTRPNPMEQHLRKMVAG